MYVCIWLQAEEESKLKAQMSSMSQELNSEKGQVMELQKSLAQTQESLSKLQSDFYGKESEVSALRQDLKVRKYQKLAKMINFIYTLYLSEVWSWFCFFTYSSCTVWSFVGLKASEEKLSLVQEELAANQNHQVGLESQIQQLKTSCNTLDQELSKLRQTHQQQEERLKELQKQKVKKKSKCERIELA